MTRTPPPDTRPPDGCWRGTFTYHGESEGRPLQVELAFVEGRIAAEGRDAGGEYLVEGSWHPATRVARWRKRYHAGDTTLYHGAWDPVGRRIHGRWKLLDDDTRGGFALSPDLGALAPRDLKPRPRTARDDLYLAIFDGDRETRASLAEDKALRKVIEAARRERDPWAERRRLSMTGVRLTARVAPALHDLVARAADTLGVTDGIDVVCVLEASPVAFVLRGDDGRITLGFSGWVLEHLSDPEILFVIGHELGHVVFEHDLLPPAVVEAAREAPSVAPLTLMRLMAWLRYAEVSADRLGLLCCGDVRVALGALFKVSSGLSSARYTIDAAAAQAIFEAAHAEWNGAETDDWYATHPFAPLRLRGLALFARSTTFHRLTGVVGGDLDEVAMEAETRALMAMMEPSFLHEDASTAREARAFVALGGAHVALADARVTRAEREALDALFARARSVGDLDEALTTQPDARRERLCALADVLSVRLPLARRLRLLEDLAVIARADRRIDAREREALCDLAFLLDIDPDYVDAVLDGVRGAMD